MLRNHPDENVQKLKEAVWRHKVVVVKDQSNLQPIKQWELVNRFDPTATTKTHGHGDIKTFMKRGGFLAVSCGIQMEAQRNRD